MGRKGKWFDTVQRILITSEPDPVETQNDDAAKDWKLDHHEKAAKLRDNKSAIRRIWQFGKSNSSGASASATAPEDAEALQFPRSPRSDNEHHVIQDLTEEAPFMETRGEEEEEEEDGERMNPGEVAASPDSKADAAPMTAWSARSKEDIAATRIQAACRGHLMMTRIQTQLYTRRLKTEKDKKVLKSQTKAVNKHSLDKAKIGEGWDHSLQSKEQMETVQKMKQEAATRRQRALSYAFSQQWRNRNTSSARAAHGPAPMYMEPGNPNWGWCWAERWMAATRPWENQTMPPPDTGRAASKSASTRLPRVAVSVQIPTATTTPKGKPFRPPNWSSSSSLSSPSTPPPRRTATLASPRSGPLHATSGLQHSKSLQPDHRRPRSSQELSANSPRRAAVPASPRCASGSSSPLHPSSGAGAQHATTTATIRLERRPRSSQDRGMSSPRLLGAKDAPLRRTASLRSELPIRLSLGSAVAAAAVGDDEGAPVTPSYIHPAKKSVRAKVRCPSPSAAAATPDMFDALESSPAPPLQVPPSPSSAKKRLSQAFADKPSASSPSKVALERVRRHSQLISSPRMSLS
ncbi:Protein IQ-DOMAIN 1 [Zea mays]|uniref:Protein IQ-DOMAIN 1 n=1 Tax=Zea mays TaxID=4577 RepID=A0A3L6E8J1_MAIZE|nr:Protein IQ-DOMAIN 1 [Zea mays]